MGRYTSKVRLAKAIEEGLKYVTEDHDVFVARARDDLFCGCALAICLKGYEQLYDLPDSTSGYTIDEALVEQIIKGKVDPIRVFADELGISMPLARKLDKLHRVDRIPAFEIAKMLRAGQV